MYSATAEMVRVLAAAATVVRNLGDYPTEAERELRQAILALPGRYSTVPGNGCTMVLDTLNRAVIESFDGPHHFFRAMDKVVEMNRAALVAP
jgi:histidinol-phosphate/aromatic aminotransferase/cobyric acid decarboxylase-like protein